MAFDVGGAKKSAIAPEINVTPLVDVVLVLLIIFMVITPLLTKQFWANVPKKPEADAPAPSGDAKPPLVLYVANDRTVRLNSEVVAERDVEITLRRAFAARNEYTLFVAADDDVPYGDAMRMMDIARGAGAFTIALVTEPLAP